jgi:hypothetical protein
VDLAVQEAQDSHGLRHRGQQHLQQRPQRQHGEPTQDSWRNQPTLTAPCQRGVSGG